MPSTIGIIYPPPEVRSIVDKTASFVARNGPEFEEKIRQNEITNTKFNFLNHNDPYHAYYQHKVKEISEGKVPETAAPTPATPEKPSSQSLQTNLQKMSISAKAQDTQTKIIEQMIILKDPPVDLDFILDAPSIQPLDIDVIKLTAQFVARNGRPFLSSIMNKEQRNPMFDFLKPQHSHFSYFTKLVDQYTKILLPQKDLVSNMKKEVENPFGILREVAYRVEWEKVQQKEKQKEEEQAEKDRVAYAQIDWHDFVVVETVDYQPNEVGNFPPPTTPQDVGARIVAQERFDSGGLESNIIDINGRILIDRIIDNESRASELASLSAKQTLSELEMRQLTESTNPNNNNKDRDKDKNVDEVAMDEDDSDEETKQKAAQQLQQQNKMSKLPLPPNPENVIIRKDYDPKAAAKTAQKAQSSGDTYFKSPLTGELISAASMSEHMRISMLDPRWLEQRQKEKREREEKEEVLASGVSIEQNLKRLAEYRSDMFGSGAEEVVIGRKVGDDAAVDEGSVWDGHSSSMDKTSKRAMTGISLEDQIKAIHASQGLVDSGGGGGDESSKIGPAIPKASVVITSAPTSLRPLVGAPIQHQLQLQQQPIPGQIIQAPQPAGAVSNYKLMSMQQQQQPPKPPPQPVVMPEPEVLEPVAKKLKTAEELLIPEQDFLAQYGIGPVLFNITVPHVPDKPEWNLNGQTISLTMPLTETVASIKNKLTEILSIPNAKQKLQYDTMFIKDTNTLAYYNLSHGALMYLQLKERGGRKK